VTFAFPLFVCGSLSLGEVRAHRQAVAGAPDQRRLRTAKRKVTVRATLAFRFFTLIFLSTDNYCREPFLPCFTGFKKAFCFKCLRAQLYVASQHAALGRNDFFSKYTKTDRQPRISCPKGGCL